MTSLQEVALAVKRLQWRHHREANSRLSRQVGLSLVQWDVLRHLSAEPDASLHRLAKLTFQTDQSMGELAKRMVEGGLITRTPGPGRAVRHGLTAHGELARRDGEGVFEEVLAESVGRLDASELDILSALLAKADSAT